MNHANLLAFFFQFFIIFLSFGMRFIPTTIRRVFRWCVDAFPLNICSSGSLCSLIAISSHMHRRLFFDMNFFLRDDLQFRIWDPGDSNVGLDDGDIKIRTDLIVKHHLHLCSAIMGLFLTLPKARTEFDGMLWWFWRQLILHQRSKRNHPLLHQQNDFLPKSYEETTRTFQFWPLKNINKGIEIMDLSWVIFTTNIEPSPGTGNGNVCVVSDVTDGSQPFDFQKKFWRYITEKIAQQENQNKLTTKTIKENNRLINLLACKAYQHPEATCFSLFRLFRAT